nr:GTPase [Desulfobacterales bacterium]
RDNGRYRVKAFTATQIPDIEGRRYPAALAGGLYPEGIPIFHEDDLPDLIREHRIDLVAFAYSDVPHTEVMHKASLAMAEGADFTLVGATYTMLRARKPVVAVCAVRTGCGKSQTTRKVCRIMREAGQRVVAVRHPMPYGDLTQQEVQRFAAYEDFDRHHCTIEEREEYEPLVARGIVVYAGIDYKKILEAAEREADVIVWDGGNNDTPFYYPDVHIVVFDPHRAGHERLYYPGETNMIMADIAVINKVDSAAAEDIETVRGNIATYAPGADIVMAESAIRVDDPEAIRGKNVLVVEDGPTLTHGDMAFGAGAIAARRFGAAALVDVSSSAAGSIRETYARYPHVRKVLPAMGYSREQIADLEATINRSTCDLVLCATPIDLPKLVHIDKPTLRVRYEYKDRPDGPRLEEVLQERLKGKIRDDG